MTVDPLVGELAKLNRRRCRELVEAAQQERQMRIRRALRKIRQAFLPGLKDRPAARAIDDALRGRRASFRHNPALREQIEQRLKQELGSLEDVPGAERIRQLLRL